MSNNERLTQALYELRAQIKNEEKLKYGKARVACTDNALLQIASLCPKRVADFESIPGIGKVFIDNYAKRFLEVIRRFEEAPTEKTVQIDGAVGGVLKELGKKLVNINRRNRLLYMPKAANKYAVDLFGTKTNPLDIIFGNGKTLAVCDSRDDDGEKNGRFQKFVRILREASKDLRDKGQNDLYIGYPFVIGRIPSGDFDVRTPLALFPVVAEKTPTTITLALDETRDVLYNNTLILANYKFSGINKPLPEEDVEEVSRGTFISSLLAFYEQNDLPIACEEADIAKFTEYTADTFPKFASGDLRVEFSIVLGRFPVCSNAIQKDFDNILKDNHINALLNDLLSEPASVGLENMASAPAAAKTPLFVSEQSLANINSLNSSQEAVISAIDTIDELVVQGPPGTGKSQVITSLISDAVSQNKTVLLVSEKKTALDVVYSRLGHLSQYALLIDDVENKEEFYSQLRLMTALSRDAANDTLSVDAVSQEIDALVGRLEVIADSMFAPNEFGIEPYRLYQKSKKVDITQEEGRRREIAANSVITEPLAALKFDAVERAHTLFEDTRVCEAIDGYINLSTAYDWLEKTKPELSELDVYELEDKLNSLRGAICEYNGKGLFARLFGKGSINKQIAAILSAYFAQSDGKLKKLLFKQTDAVIEGIRVYAEFWNTRAQYMGLSADETEYVHALIKLRDKCSCTLQAANDVLYNRLITKQIEKFESKHRDILVSIDNFEGIIKKMSEAMDKKQKLTRQKLEALLMADMYNLTMSKRHGEILRVIESKRKWSVNKFINRFSFELFKSVKIWLLTPEVVSEIIPLQTGVFDLVIFDEASQMFVEKGIPSILRAKKVVIAGDSKQLRPSNLGAGRVEFDEDFLGEDEEVPAALEEESLLDLARFKYDDILLNFHYRSRYEELIAFSNYAFYDGRLYVSPNTEKLEKPPIEVHKIDDGLWVDKSNMQEARYIVNMLKTFFNERQNDETIGIITFNISQRDLIDDLIDEECVKDPDFAAKIRTELVRRRDGEDIGLFVKNIETVQGDERDVIIFSVGYARNADGKIVRKFGWLNQQGGENRLNVAISRAKKKIHIVTSLDPSEIITDDIKNKGPHYLKKYLEYAFAVSAGDTESARQILLSLSDTTTPAQSYSSDDDFENQVCAALIQRGYEVDAQVGIGGYRIDLAVKKHGDYVLGIECDGRLYQNSRSARERDFHRQKYLESRGWKIHRIWSANWWKNPKLEIDKICKIVDSVG